MWEMVNSKRVSSSPGIGSYRLSHANSGYVQRGMRNIGLGMISLRDIIKAYLQSSSINGTRLNDCVMSY